MRRSALVTLGISGAAVGVFLTWLQTGSAQSLSGRPVTDPLKLGKIQLLPGQDFEFISPTGIELWALSSTGANYFLRGTFAGNSWIPVSGTANIYALTGGVVLHNNLHVLGHTSSANVSAVSATFGTITIGACHGAGCGGGGGGVTDPLTVNGWTPASGVATVNGVLHVVPGSSTVDPTRLGTLVARWRADAGIFSDTGCSSVITTGGLVACWHDLTGHGNDAIQATVGNQPYWWTGRAAGLPGVLFDGTKFLKVVTDSSNPANFTLCGVVRPLATGGAGSKFDILANWDGGTTHGMGLRTISWNNPLLESVLGLVSAGSVVAPEGHGEIISGQVQMVCETFDGTTAAVYYDGVSVASGAASLAYNSTYVIGALDNIPNEPFVGDIHEVLLYNSALGAGALTSALTYSRQYWNALNYSH